MIPLRRALAQTNDSMFSEAFGSFASLEIREVINRPTFVKNGVAALRQEALRADRHFSNASNKMFEAIIP